jgi:hypothetical protein
MDKNLLEDEKDLAVLKSSIGFGTAFKATLGFYAAQFVATVLGLLFLGILAAIGLGVVYLVAR